MVSWISWGIENQGGGKRGMQGAPVIFGVSAEDTEFPDLQGTVQEYNIDHSQSRFRFWNEPYSSPATTDVEMLSQGGYSAMKFKTDAIYGVPLNITSGTNRLVWAFRSSSYMHVGRDSYHEGCDGMTRTRGRGGGENNPWVMDFQNGTDPIGEDWPEIDSAFAVRAPLTAFMAAGALLA